MENRETKEYFLSLLDDVDAFLKGDRAREDDYIYEYSLTPKEESKEEADYSSCHICPAFSCRNIYAEPIYNKNTKVLFILPYPDGDMMLNPKSTFYISKWVEVLGLKRDEASVVSLIKCPVNSFNSSYADSCKLYLKEEMASLKPSFLFLLGLDTARYMTKRNLDMEDFREKGFRINDIPTLVTYTPRELAQNNQLRVAVWDDLQKAKEMLKK